MRNGECFLHVKWDSHIHGKDCFLLPTPQASDAKRLCWGTALRLFHGHLKRESGARIGSALKWKLPVLWLRRGGQKFTARLNPCFFAWLMGFPERWTLTDKSEH